MEGRKKETREPELSGLGLWKRDDNKDALHCIFLPYCLILLATNYTTANTITMMKMMMMIFLLDSFKKVVMRKKSISLRTLELYMC